MKIIIDIPQETYDFLNKYGTDGGIIEKAIVNGTPIPDNATNGDMIKAMFPITKIDECNKDMYGEPHIHRVFGLDCVTDFTGYWWNAPYRGNEDDSN